MKKFGFVMPDVEKLFRPFNRVRQKFLLEAAKVASRAPARA